MKPRALSAAVPSPLAAAAAAAHARRSFRSDAALEAIARASEDRVPNVALYNYPSFSGAFSALFARLFHDRAGLPCLVLPFSSVEPLRAEDLYSVGLERCYLLDFVGPKGFVATVASRSSGKIIAFDHRKCVLSAFLSNEVCPENVDININTEKSSAISAYKFFSAKLQDTHPTNDEVGLLDPKDRDRVETILNYIEDKDLRRWILPDIRALNIGLSEWLSKLNCITNPYMYEQLLEMSSSDLIAKGHTYIAARKDAAVKFLDKAFKVRLGRGLYGECLGVRADGNSDLSDEIGKQLSIKSAAAGLRPIGAVIYMQRNNLKMCLRGTDDTADTSEVAKAYGGGGTPCSSSFIIKMDEYNCWLSGN